ncbi:hypothetical protein [Maricaulis maris]|uniref:hypothetical protein n=1 Tax=Maricaulis maris TaxID=74318 RepID=UPI003B8E29F7
MLSMIALASALSTAPLGVAVGESAPKPALGKAMQNEFSHSLTIEIQAASANPLVLTYGSLTGGEWDRIPTPGSTLEPGDSITYVNGVVSAYDALGGMISLSLPTGATFAIEFGWAVGGSVACTAEPANLETVAVNVELINTLSDEPTCAVTITDRRAD